jgi:hypothetical protein
MATQFLVPQLSDEKVVQSEYSHHRQSNDRKNAPAENRTRGPTMATLDFTTKPLVLFSFP